MAKPQIEPCDVWELARRGARLEGELALAQAPRLAAELADTAGALRYAFSGLIDAQGRPAARLELAGELRVRCDRCGGAVALPIDERAEFHFVADEAELEKLPIDDLPEEPLVGSRRFDLGALVEDQAILALPISPRHAGCVPVDLEPAEGEAETYRPFEALAALKRSRQ
jgi:uncharacterized protein